MGSYPSLKHVTSTADLTQLMRWDDLRTIDAHELRGLIGRKWPDHADEDTLRAVVQWAIDIRQARNIIDRLSYDQWCTLSQTHLTPPNLSSQNALADHVAELESGLSPARAMELQRGRIARDRVDYKSNVANASVLVGGKVLFTLMEGFESGVDSRASTYQAPQHHHHAADQVGQDLISKNDSEVRLLMRLEQELKKRLDDIPTDAEITIQMFSNNGACDSCKDRMDDFLVKFFVEDKRNIAIDYQYQHYKPKGRGDFRH
ncbi:MAG: hypothetical protein AAFR59_11395, partial [Bacteroidota bacterium]